MKTDTCPTDPAKPTPGSAHGAADAGKLLPCPFCGSSNAHLQKTYWHSVMCFHCGSEGPPAKGDEDDERIEGAALMAEAAMLWNTRSLPTGGDDGTV